MAIKQSSFHEDQEFIEIEVSIGIEFVYKFDSINTVRTLKR